MSIVHVRCCKCSAMIYMDDDVHAHLSRSGRDFWCLNGHEQSYKSANAKDEEIKALRARLEREQKIASDAIRTANEKVLEMRREKNKCPDCPKKFDSPGALKRHVLRAHRHLKALPANAGKSN